MFYLNADKNRLLWRLVDKCTLRNLCDVPDVDKDDLSIQTSNDIPILQEDNSSIFCIWVELLELDNVHFD